VTGSLSSPILTQKESVNAESKGSIGGALGGGFLASPLPQIVFSCFSHQGDPTSGFVTCMRSNARGWGRPSLPAMQLTGLASAVEDCCMYIFRAEQAK